MTKSKAIWATAAGMIWFALYQNQLDTFGFLIIIYVAYLLDGWFADRKPAVSVPPPISEVGKHLITTEGVKSVRNLLLRHHEMKRTDVDYCASTMAKDTVAIVAHLNVYLKGHKT